MRRRGSKRRRRRRGNTRNHRRRRRLLFFVVIVEINKWTTGDTDIGIRGGRRGAVWVFLLEGVGVEEGAVVVDVGVNAGDVVSGVESSLLSC